MPTDKPTPPTGYQIVNLPNFLKPANANTKTVRAESQAVPGLGQIIADVSPNDPHTIMVREPRDFTQPVQTHESTHVFQMTRNPAFTTRLQGQSNASNLKDFDYGGVDGLLAAQRAHKTIANFNAEQQATMVADYQRLTADALKRGDRTTLARVIAAYHPFVSQLASVPPRGVDMTRMTQQDLTPAPPSPPVDVAGAMMLPDKLIGGLNPAATGRKIGTEKRFANGKIGVWDGHGWAQR